MKINLGSSVRMKILVDADARPVTRIVERNCKTIVKRGVSTVERPNVEKHVIIH